MSIDIFSVFGSPSKEGSLILHRDPGAVTGSEFIKNNMNLSGAVREKNILDEFMHGNMPDFMRNFRPIFVADGINTITYLVMPDYLCIGSDSDYVRMPMNPHTAQAIADQYDCSLPTVKMVNNIWQSAVNKLAPKPWGPPYDKDMERTHRIGTHNGTIQNQLVGLDYTQLTAGHKKDVVLTDHLYPNNPNKRVAIYGWFYLDGHPIQDLNTSSHSDTYSDYSHGIRLCANDVMVNGATMRIKDVFSNPQLAGLLNCDGVLKFTRY